MPLSVKTIIFSLKKYRKELNILMKREIDLITSHFFDLLKSFDSVMTLCSDTTLLALDTLDITRTEKKTKSDFEYEIKSLLPFSILLYSKRHRICMMKILLMEMKILMQP